MSDNEIAKVDKGVRKRAADKASSFFMYIPPILYIFLIVYPGKGVNETMVMHKSEGYTCVSIIGID